MSKRINSEVSLGETGYTQCTILCSMHYLKCIDIFSNFQNVSDIRDKPLLLSSSSDSDSSDDDLEEAILRQNRERYQIEEAIEELESQENSKDKIGLRKINSSDDVLSPAKTSVGEF